MGEKRNEFLEAFERSVNDRPTALAFRAAGRLDVTYGELWSLATELAAAIAARVAGRAPVLVCGRKEALTVAGFLGCLMSGHAFVPVDADLPAERVRAIAGQIPGAALLATCDAPAELAGALEGCPVLDARGLLERGPIGVVPPRSVWVAGDETQYVIFTSGSTGRPKGIEVTAANVAAFMRWLAGFPVIREGGCAFLDQAHYSFDLSEYQLVGALATGGSLHAVDPSAGDFSALFDDLAASGIDVWVSTPSFADVCLADPGFGTGLLPRLRLLLFCGETLRHATAAELRRRFPGAIVANTYGPTESTVAVTYCEIGEKDLADPAPLPVGRPRPGTEIRVVDRASGAPLPAGSSGEIVICGDTVARGYYADPERTAAAFFETTLADGTPARAYRTGDLGHLDETGMLHYEGRADSLVKVNGYRIELSEVEGALAAVPGVASAVVVPVERAGRVSSLAGFVTLDPGHPGRGGSAFEVSSAIRAALARLLPSYMVPRQLRLVERMPLTANGKIDRRALSARLARRPRAAAAGA